MWNETVKSLRKLVNDFDIQYFFTVAESLSSRYKSLNNYEDLVEITEFDMLEICRRIGLLTDVTHKKLEHVNYLRNHASAAHPNDNELSGYEMISILENCIKYAINAEPDVSVISIRSLFTNIRLNVIPNDDYAVIGEEIRKQPQERVDDFLLSLFGLYCDERQEQMVIDNIEGIVPYVWNCSTIDTQYRVGTKFGVFRKNGNVFKKDRCQRFLEIVEGLEFKDEDSLSAELIDKLQDLRSVHFAMNNFYNEYPYAASISESLPRYGIPTAAMKMFVKVICICYIGNGMGYRKGVDERALPFYSEFVNLFRDIEIKEFILLFRDSEFVVDMQTPKADERTRDLAKIFREKTSDVHLRRALEIIINFPKLVFSKLYLESAYINAVKHM